MMLNGSYQQGELHIQVGTKPQILTGKFSVNSKGQILKWNAKRSVGIHVANQNQVLSWKVGA